MPVYENSNLLQSIIMEFLKQPDRQLNYSQMAQSLHVNRRVIAGAFNILFDLGILQCGYNSPTNKLFMLKTPINPDLIIEQIQNLINQTNLMKKPIKPGLTAKKINLQKIHPSKPTQQIKESSNKEYTIDDWEDEILPYFDLFLSKGDIQYLIQDLEFAGGDLEEERSVLGSYQEFLKKELESAKNQEAVKEFLDIFAYGFSNFDVSSLTTFLYEYLDELKT